MGKAKYATPEHRAQRKHWTPIVARGDAYCTEVVCLIEQDGGTRWIPPDSDWHVSHTPDGQHYLGPSHQRCNTSEGATRGNRQRNQPNRWEL